MKWHEEVGGGGGGGSCLVFENGGAGDLDHMKMLVMVEMEGNQGVFHSHNIAAQLMGCLRPMAKVQAFFLFLFNTKYPFIFDMLLPYSHYFRMTSQ
jgi:hypothetical protein